MVERHLVDFIAIAMQRSDLKKTDDMFNRVLIKDNMAVIGLFGLMTRFEPSVLRASAMAALAAAATTAGLPAQRLRVLALALLQLFRLFGVLDAERERQRTRGDVREVRGRCEQPRAALQARPLRADLAPFGGRGRVRVWGERVDERVGGGREGEARDRDALERGRGGGCGLVRHGSEGRGRPTQRHAGGRFEES